MRMVFKNPLRVSSEQVEAFILQKLVDCVQDYETNYTQYREMAGVLYAETSEQLFIEQEIEFFKDALSNPKKMETETYNLVKQVSEYYGSRAFKSITKQKITYLEQRLKALDPETPNVCQQIPKRLLIKFFNEFNEYLHFENEAQFIDHVRSCKPLTPDLFRENSKTHLAFCFDGMLKKKGVDGKTKIMLALFGTRSGGEKPTRPDLVNRIEAFIEKI